MKDKTLDALIRVLNIGASLLLTIFSGITAFLSLACFFMSIVDKSFVSFIGSVLFGFMACVLWSIRKDVL